MSEINGYGDEYVYGEVVPGWHLVQLKNCRQPYDSVAFAPFVMEEGSFGLTFSNDPDFVFDLEPLPEPPEDCSDEEHNEYMKVFHHYQERLVADVDVGYRLGAACVKDGWIPNDGGFVVFIMQKMYECYTKNSKTPEHIHRYE